MAPFILDENVAEPKGSGQARRLEERRIAFTERDRFLAWFQRQERTVAPHSVTAARFGAVRHRGRARGIAHEIGTTAHGADGRQSVRRCRRATIGTLES